MKTYSKILSCLAILAFTAGCSARLSFDQLTESKPSSDLNVMEYSSSTMGYDISILSTMQLLEEEYDDTTGYELFIDTLMTFEEGARMLSIYKYHSKKSRLKEAWDELTSNRQQIEDFRIYSEGMTDYLSIPSFYEHSACTINERNTESVSFLFRGDSSSFYLMSIQVITQEGYPDNLKELLYSAKSINLK